MLSGGDGRFVSVNEPKQNIMNMRAKSCELPVFEWEWVCPGTGLTDGEEEDPILGDGPFAGD